MLILLAVGITAIALGLTTLLLMRLEKSIAIPTM